MRVVCVRARVCVCMCDVCTYVHCAHMLCAHVCAYVCTHVCVCCVHVHVCACVLCAHSTHVCMCVVCVHTCVHVHVSACMRVVCTCVHMHVHCVHVRVCACYVCVRVCACVCACALCVCMWSRGPAHCTSMVQAVGAPSRWLLPGEPPKMKTVGAGGEGRKEEASSPWVCLGSSSRIRAGRGAPPQGAVCKDNGRKLRQGHHGGNWGRTGLLAGAGEALSCTHLFPTLPAAGGHATSLYPGPGQREACRELRWASSWLPRGRVPWELRALDPRKF